LKTNLVEAKEEKEQAKKAHNDDTMKLKEQDDAINELRTNFEKEKENSKNCLLGQL
jgi:hypothetical protein